MRSRMGFALLAAASLALTAWRYSERPDRDATAVAALAARLAELDVLVTVTEVHPAYRLMHLRRIGCETGPRLVLVPDGAGSAVSAQLLPDAARRTLPAADPLRPRWHLAVERGAGCRDGMALLAALGDTPL